MALREFTPVMTTPFPNIVDGDFRETMKRTATHLRGMFQAHTSILLPGSGTFAMEAVARQFCTNKRIVVIQNGYFGFRWSEIIAQGQISTQLTLLKAEPVSSGVEPQFAPHCIKKVRQFIAQNKPQVILMSHTDTSTGLMLTHDYIKAVSAAGREVGATVILDGIASGCIWTPMIDLGLDVIVTAPQKAFYAPASVGIVLLSEKTRAELGKEKNTSFTLDLAKWAGVQEAYENGGFAYHTTLPTVGITQFSKALVDLYDMGLHNLHENQAKLGHLVRGHLESKGFKSVAESEFSSPTVLVFYCNNPADVVAKFKAQGFKVAGGFGFFLGETKKPNSFRVGLFGFDKLRDVPGTFQLLQEVMDKIFVHSKL